MKKLKVIDDTGEGGQVTLDKAILLYGDGNKSVATIHEVSRTGKGAVILPGRGISLANLQDLVISLTTDKKSQFLPDNVLACSFTRLVWWKPSCVRPIWFDTGDRKFTKRMSGAKVTHPALLFRVTPHGFAAWALATDKRPNESTTVYRAPYYNVYDNGNMCAGNAAVPRLLMPSNTAKFEDAFFNSAFTHTNIAGNQLCAYPGGHNAFWMAMKGQGQNPRRKLIKTKWLVPFGENVGNIINK